MDLGRWRRGLGLEQYKAIFREGAIDTSVLGNLTQKNQQLIRCGGSEDRQDQRTGLLSGIHNRSLVCNYLAVSSLP